MGSVLEAAETLGWESRGLESPSGAIPSYGQAQSRGGESLQAEGSLLDSHHPGSILHKLYST